MQNDLIESDWFESAEQILWMSTYGSFLLLAITCIILSTSVSLYVFSQSSDCNQQTEFSTAETSQTIAPLP